MSQQCNHDCGSCKKDCSERSLLAPLNKNSTVKKVIGVVSGKGGVGKSSITSLLAVLKQREGYKVGVLDADITGPSIARVFGVEGQQLYQSNGEIIPAKSYYETKIMSTNLLLTSPEDPVLWRGPILAGMVKQFWSDVRWEEVDYMFVDMPPGTGDVALTVMQSIPLNGIVMVSVPQDMISMIVAKAVKMAKMLNVNVLGVVENMSYIQCPDCDKKIKLFDGEETEKFLQDMDLQLLGELPMTKEIVNITHKGVNEVSEDLDNILENIVEKIK